MVKLNLDYNKGFNLCVYAPLKKLDESIKNLLKEGKAPQDFVNIPDEIGYFINRQTSNLFSIVDIEKEHDVLEVNACFGGLTQYLCEKAKTVTALEFSIRNADIIKSRLSDKDNLEIIVGNINSIKFEKKFDYIVITDILEFAAFFFKGDNPYKQFLSYFKSLLKPNGKIILSIFNKFGLRNWIGGFDEHTMKKYDSLQGYPKYSIKSFTKVQLENIFKSSGFSNVKFYYPLPSHYYIYSVLSDEYLEQENYDYSFVRYLRGGYLHDMDAIDTENLFHKIFSMNQFEIFANSFFIIAGDEPVNEVAFYSEYINGIGKNIILDKNKETKYIKLTPYNDKGKAYLARMQKYGNTEMKRLEDNSITNISFAKMTKKQKKDYYVCDYPKGESLKSLYIGVRKTNEECNFIQFIKDFKDFIYKLYPNQVEMDFNTNKMEHIFGEAELKNVSCVKNSLYQIELEDVFNEGGNYTVINYGSYCPYYLPINYLVFVGLVGTLKQFAYKKEYLDEIGITFDELKIYSQMYSYHISHPNIDFE